MSESSSKITSGARVGRGAVRPSLDSTGRIPAGSTRASKPPRKKTSRAGEKVGDLSGLAQRFRVPLIVFAALALVIVSLYGPVRGLYAAWRDGQSLGSQISELDQSNNEYQGDIERLQSREGIEDEARKKGYVSEGETSVVVEGLDEGDSTSQGTTATELPWYLSVGDFVFQYQAR